MNRANNRSACRCRWVSVGAAIAAVVAASLTPGTLPPVLRAAVSITAAAALVWIWLRRSRDTLPRPAAMPQAISTITDLLDSLPDTSMLSGEVCRIACEEAGAAGLTLWAVDLETSRIIPQCGHSFPAGSVQGPIDTTQSASERVSECLGGRRWTTYSGRDAFCVLCHGSQVDSVLLIPLPYGAAHVDSVAVFEYTRAHAATRALPAYSARLLSLAQIVQRTALSKKMISKELGKLRVVSRIMCDVGPQASVSDVRDAVTQAAGAVLETPLAVLLTVDPCMGDVETSRTPEVSDAVLDASVALGMEVLTDRLATAAFVRGVDDLEVCLPAVGDGLRETGIRSVLAYPIRSSVGANGALVTFYTAKNGAKDNEHLIEPVATQASAMLSYALAIEQSRSLLDDLAGTNQELSVQATSDGLTGLANHRTLQQKLSQLCRLKGEGAKQVFSLVMVDVDHFKIYNDTHGHQEGDVVLQEVARILASGLRSRDLAARYGGEEFALIIRGVGKEDARSIADRIRGAVSDQHQAQGAVTVSMGISEFPADGSSPDEIIQRADKALYRAKATGRNRVVVWGSANSEAADSESPAQADQAVPRRLLVVEHEGRSGVGLLQTVLEEANYEIEAARNCSQAGELLQTRAFDVALVTSQALGEDGLRGIGVLAGAYSHVPVIFIAGPEHTSENREALRLGASDVLMSPFSPSDLPLVIERNLERLRLDRQKLTRRKTDLVMQTIDALVAAVDSRDHSTVGHTKRVSALSLGIADRLMTSREERTALELAAKLHDIGKIALPDSTLNKQSELNAEEWAAVRNHPSLGSQIVSEVDDLAYVSTIIRHHHERLDGSGYPDGLRGTAIPYLSRIIAVADAYDSFTHGRSEGHHMPPHDALALLRQHAGTYYELEIIAALEAHLGGDTTLWERDAA